jgi:hypothetical protein
VDKAAEQFRASDVATWAMIALGTWAAALLAANVSGLVPPQVYASLHATQLTGSTMAQLRVQVGALEAEAVRQRADANRLAARFGMTESATTELTGRIAAVEASLPRIVEAQSALADGRGIDETITGAIADPGGDAVTLEADGGIVSVQRVPLVLAPRAPVVEPLPLSGFAPKVITADGTSQGVALGVSVAAGQIEEEWKGYQAKVGTLLVGLSPVLGVGSSGEERQLIAGPMLDMTSAMELCGRLEPVGIPCTPVPFAGDPLPQ